MSLGLQVYNFIRELCGILGMIHLCTLQSHLRSLINFALRAELISDVLQRERTPATSSRYQCLDRFNLTTGGGQFAYASSHYTFLDRLIGFHPIKTVTSGTKNPGS